MLRFAPIVVSLLLAGVACAQTPGFRLVGHALGTTSSGVTGLTRDGTIATGYSWLLPPGPLVNPGFTYTVGGGRYDWGLEPGMPASTSPTGINSNGTVIVGSWAQSWATPGRPYRRVGNGPIQDLGLLAGEERGFATGVSGDGAIVVGAAEHSQLTNAYGEAFRWTASGGMQGLGYLRPNGVYSRANGISRDGSTIVGMSDDGPFGTEEAYRWTAATGMQLLPNLPGAPFIEAEAHAVNEDGSIAVGRSSSPNGLTHAVRWTPAGVEDIALLMANTNSVAYAVSDSAGVVAGAYQELSGTLAFVWTSGTGMVDFRDFLGSHGILVPAAYRLEELFAVSGDGLTFGGRARNLTTNQPEGFIATIPSPGTVVIVLGGAAWACRRRRAAGID